MRAIIVIFAVLAMLASPTFAADDKNEHGGGFVSEKSWPGYPETVNGPGLHFSQGRWCGTRGSLPQMVPPTMITIDRVLNAKVVMAYNQDAADNGNLPAITPAMLMQHPGAVAWLILVEANRQALAPEKAKVLREAQSAKVVKRDTRRRVYVMGGAQAPWVEFGFPAVIQPAQVAVIQPSREGDPNDYRYLNVQTFILNPADTKVCIADLADWHSGAVSLRSVIPAAAPPAEERRIILARDELLDGRDYGYGGDAYSIRENQAAE